LSGIGIAFFVSFSRSRQESRLNATSFVAMQDRLVNAGLRFVDDGEAYERVAAFVDTYEPFLNGIADHLLLELPPWSVDGDAVDNWVRSPRGRTAKRLIDTVDPAPEDERLDP
jgi:hypothetical protein